MFVMKSTFGLVISWRTTIVPHKSPGKRTWFLMMTQGVSGSSWVFPITQGMPVPGRLPVFMSSRRTPVPRISRAPAQGIGMKSASLEKLEDPGFKAKGWDCQKIEVVSSRVLRSLRTAASWSSTVWNLDERSSRSMDVPRSRDLHGEPKEPWRNHLHSTSPHGSLTCPLLLQLYSGSPPGRVLLHRS